MNKLLKGTKVKVLRPGLECFGEVGTIVRRLNGGESSFGMYEIKFQNGDRWDLDESDFEKFIEETKEDKPHQEDE
jgi:hypothetical protein